MCSVLTRSTVHSVVCPNAQISFVNEIYAFGQVCVVLREVHFSPLASPPHNVLSPRYVERENPARSAKNKSRLQTALAKKPVWVSSPG